MQVSKKVSKKNDSIMARLTAQAPQKVVNGTAEKISLQTMVEIDDDTVSWKAVIPAVTTVITAGTGKISR